MIENIAQVTPDIIIVVNFGVSGCHLNVTPKVANEIEQNNPKNQPKKVPISHRKMSYHTSPLYR